MVIGLTVLRFHFEYECTFTDSFKTACQHQNNAERDVAGNTAELSKPEQGQGAETQKRGNRGAAAGALNAVISGRSPLRTRPALTDNLSSELPSAQGSRPSLITSLTNYIYLLVL